MDLTLLPPVEITPAPGITLSYINAGDAPVSQVTVLLPAGTASASTGSSLSPSPAVARLAADAMYEGSRNHPGALLADTFDYNGTWVRTSAMPLHLQITLSTPTDTLPRVLSAFIDCIAHPTFPPSAVAMLRGRAAANRSLALEKVATLTHEAALRMLLPDDSPYACFPSPEQILAVTRPQLVDFHRMALSAGPIHAFMAGRFPETAVEALSRALVDAFAPTSGKTLDIAPVKPSNNTNRIEQIPVPRAVQSALTMVFPAPLRSHPDYLPLRVAVTALGGYFGSRLTSNIREDKGFTYGISATLNGLPGFSFTEINAQFDPAYTDALLAELLAELRNLATNPPQGEELRHIKLYMLTLLANSVDNPLSMMQHAVMHYTVGTPNDYFRRQLDTIQTITPDIIASVAARYLNPDRALTAITHPAKP